MISSALYNWASIALIILFDVVTCHSKCSYEPPSIEDVEIGVPLENNHEFGTRFKRGVYRNVRIIAYYDKSIDELSTEQQNFIKTTLVPEATEFWERALLVQRSEAAIRLNRKCVTSQYYLHRAEKRRSCAKGCNPITKCGQVQVPDSHLLECQYCASHDPMSCRRSGPPDGSGVKDTDFVLYVSAVLSDRCRIKDTVAYAAHCQLESQMDRPIAGHVNLCPESLSVSARNQEVLISTVKHEILHALGFSSGLYAFYRDAESGKPLTERNQFGKPKVLNKKRGYFQWSEKTIKSVTRAKWWTKNGYVNHTVNMFVTPRVTAEVREHFGCRKLEGAELENQGGDGTALTHWEKRIFENEAMTGTHTQNPAYSRITLALMEDTGWYRANYSVAEQLIWGKHLGCEFAMQSCGDWIRKQKAKGESAAPFCDQVKSSKTSSTSTTTCTAERDSVALCNLVRYDSPVEQTYQNFERLRNVPVSQLGFYGGSVEMADYCPYNQEFEWKNDSWTAEVRDSRCEFASNTPPGASNAALETYGEGSKCFLHSGPWKQRKCALTRTFAHYGAGCYEFTCNDGVLYVSLMNGTVYYPCYKHGQRIPVNRIVDGWLHSGVIVCPSCSLVCPSDFECKAEDTFSHLSVGDPLVIEPCRASHNHLSFITLLLCLYFGSSVCPIFHQ